MITSYLQGGLGNQMFQIAAAYVLSKKLNVDCAFNFNMCYTPAQGNTSDKYSDNIFKNIKNENIDLNSFKRYMQPKFSYNELPMVDNIMLIGDFQSEKYFDGYSEEVKSLFYFDKLDMQMVKEYLESEIKIKDKITSIHVRRGDYLTKPNFHPTCGLEYYKKAIEILDDGNTDFIFVSDDIKWCRDNFKGDNIFYSPFTNELYDLYLLMNCNNHIIANSSFSWWGAYLCGQDNKVVSPKIWFGPEGPQDTEDIYLDNWIKL
jgi:hypothetical protein